MQPSMGNVVCVCGAVASVCCTHSTNSLSVWSTLGVSLPRRTIGKLILDTTPRVLALSWWLPSVEESAVGGSCSQTLLSSVSDLCILKWISSKGPGSWMWLHMCVVPALFEAESEGPQIWAQPWQFNYIVRFCLQKTKQTKPKPKRMGNIAHCKDSVPSTTSKQKYRIRQTHSRDKNECLYNERKRMSCHFPLLSTWILKSSFLKARFNSAGDFPQIIVHICFITLASAPVPSHQ